MGFAFLFTLVAALVFLWGRSVQENHQGEPAPQTALRPQTPESSPKTGSLPTQGIPPFRVSFLAEAPPQLDKPVPVTLVVQTHTQAWPASAVGELRVELRLRLPAGVRLESADWTRVELSAEERNDPSGPWSLFERTVPVRVISSKTLPSELLRETVPLKVVEEGTNWVMTIRARLVKGTEAWETFGVLFATLEGEAAEFHTIPRGTREIPQPQPIG